MGHVARGERDGLSLVVDADTLEPVETGQQVRINRIEFAGNAMRPASLDAGRQTPRRADRGVFAQGEPRLGCHGRLQILRRGQNMMVALAALERAVDKDQRLHGA